MNIILKKMDKYFIGVMTGTSADALDACVVSFNNQFQLIEKASTNLEEFYKKDYEECLANGYKTTEESEKLLELENILNIKTVKLIEELLSKKQIDINEICAIGFSGQTVFHTNDKSYQIGDPQKIADSLGIKVLSDFRNFDIARGGLGAPLIPAFHKFLYSQEGKNKLIFNIGGIANGTYLNGQEISMGSDVGPGNCLMDLVASKKFNTPFDLNGAEASKGEINNNLFNKLTSGCKNMKYPRADDKKDYYELIDDSFLEIDSSSLMRTLAEFTAEKIKEFYDFCNKPEEIIFHGGGTMNIFLMELIKDKLGVEIKTTDNEIPSKFVEAAAFAYLAFLEKGEIFEPK